ncbi:hypothetical protein [Bacillus niameyensis]|uniref:hypothetical protein n=1 Tax=Bacillus niameyensis TaxID=1522308 RepID=UPI0007809619|nr:hypothetical protein [Bacillus niameyensis]
MQPEQQTMTLKDWIVTMILLFIPFVNIIMLIIWAVDNKNLQRNLFAKAYLIVTAGFIAIVIIFYIFIFIIIFALAGSGY